MQEIIVVQIGQQKMETDLAKTENGCVKRLFLFHVDTILAEPNEMVYPYD